MLHWRRTKVVSEILEKRVSNLEGCQKGAAKKGLQGSDNQYLLLSWGFGLLLGVAHSLGLSKLRQPFFLGCRNGSSPFLRAASKTAALFSGLPQKPQPFL
jgi:hypothetical protein